LNAHWFGRSSRRSAGCAPTLHYALAIVIQPKKIAAELNTGNRKAHDLAFCYIFGIYIELSWK